MHDSNMLLAMDVVLAVAVILVASIFCGRLALLVGQSRVVGEMVAGVLLGPTLLGTIAPGMQRDLFSAEVQPVLFVLSNIGLTFYMFLVGAGTWHRRITRQHVRDSVILSVSGMLAPLVLGAIVALSLYAQLSRPDVSRLEFALFVGGALAVTAFPMLARIVYERGVQNTKLGVIALITASIDDAAAWCFLAFLTAIRAGDSAAAAMKTFVVGGLFVAFMLLVVPRLLRRVGQNVERTGQLSYEVFALVLVIVVLAGWFTDSIGLFSVFGGFVAGLAMPPSPAFRQALHDRMMQFVSILLLPIFFAFSGLHTELGGISTSSFLLSFLLILAAGFVGKYCCCGATARLLGFSWREASAIGGLMNARGLMILVFINIGLSQEMITLELYSILALVGIVMTASAVPIFRASLSPQRESQLPDSGGTAARATKVEVTLSRYI